MSIESEILRYIYKRGGELNYYQIEAKLTDDNFHSEVEVLGKILDGLVKAGCLNTHPFFDVLVYTITPGGVEYMGAEVNWR
ncbi:hypothetical protein WBG78_01115 [Chryseolinea sp. T2]|uniref:hypothetical protein n=1 Tax=Chryseolinea sp. T2 TaxID=3129255 RepID=UPI003076C233